MPETYLVAYGTKHGSTREVAEAIARTLTTHHLEVETLPAGRVDDVTAYGGVVLGGALYMGRWHPDAAGFLERHRHALAAMPVATFAMGPRTMEEVDTASSRAQLVKALARVPEVDPFAIGVFGGVVDPRVLRFPFSRFPASDARDWEAIRAWASKVAAVFDYGKAASGTRDHRSRFQQTPR
jgi:menaquinone-dependent protoporphyrinogen oxidase